MDNELRDQLLEVSADLVEAIADQLLADGILKDIPILGTAVQVAKLGKTITDRIFLEKVKRFILALGNVTEDDKRKFFERMEADPTSRRKAGEVVALVLDRLDDLGKPEILARVFKEYLRNEITLSEFRRLAAAIDLAFVEDLHDLASSFRNASQASQECLSALLRTGLTEASQTAIALFDRDFAVIPIRVTPLGQLFVNIMNGRSLREG